MSDSGSPSPLQNIVFFPREQQLTTAEAMNHPDYQDFWYLAVNGGKVVAGIKTDDKAVLLEAMVAEFEKTKKAKADEYGIKKAAIDFIGGPKIENAPRSFDPSSATSPHLVRRRIIDKGGHGKN